MNGRCDLAGQRGLFGIPVGLDTGGSERVSDILFLKAESLADIVDHLLFGLIARGNNELISVLILGHAGSGVNNSQEVVEQRFIGSAFRKAGTYYITDRGDLLDRTDNGSIHTVPESRQRLLGAVDGVLVLGAVTVSNMTEAVYGKEQVIGLVGPVVALGTDKDDLVLDAFVEGQTKL